MTAIISVFLFRQKIPKIIEGILSRVTKFRHGDTELEFLSKQANESLAKAAHGGYLSTLNIEAIFETVKLNDWATLIMARMLMRKGLVEIVGTEHGLGPSPSLEKLMSICKEKSLVPETLLDDLEKLREITFFAEWWNGRVPVKADWKWAKIIANQSSRIYLIYSLLSDTTSFNHLLHKGH